MLTAGQFGRQNTSTGKVELGKATSQAEGLGGGVALKSGTVGRTISILIQGTLNLGNALSAVAYGAPIYLSDTDGKLATAEGTKRKVLGYVVPGWGNPSGTPDKLLRLVLQHLPDA